MRQVVVTLANAGRLDHVVRQAQALPDHIPHIVVALGDADVLAHALPGSTVDTFNHFNLAAARNRGAQLAVAHGARQIIFLDADCIPGPDLLRYYANALRVHPDAVSAGPVTYMPPSQTTITSPDPHPARPNPAPGELLLADDYNLFWSLSFAVTAELWRDITFHFGGFDTGYTGYGGEDTDFAYHLRDHSIPLYWVGGAHAFHQWHPVSNPPVEHVADIVTNANRFHSIWDTWPMGGWLDSFEERGLVEFLVEEQRYRVVAR